MSKRLEAIFKFLQAARNLVKNKDMSKEGILRFAKQQFGEIDDFLRLQIDNLFKKPKVSSPVDQEYKKKLRRLEGALGSLDSKQPGFKQAANELIEKITKLKKDYKAGKFVPEGQADVVSIKKVIDEKKGDDFIDFVRKQGDEEGANKIQKEVDRLNKAIEDANKRVANEKGLTDSPLDDLERILKGEDPPAPTDKEMTERALAELTKKKSLGTMSQEAMIRSAVREFLSRRLKDGTLTIPDAGDRDAILRFTQGADPIDIFRKAYGEDAIKGVSEIQYDYGDMLQGTKTFDELGDMFEKLFYRESQGGLMYNTKPKPVKDYGFDSGLMSLEETEKMLRKDLKEKEILENFDVTDRTKNADGGLINILKL